MAVIVPTPDAYRAASFDERRRMVNDLQQLLDAYTSAERF